MEQGNMTQVRRAVEEVWNRGHLAMADALFAPTYVNHGGLIPDLVHGPEAIKVAVALYRSAFPDLHITMESLTAEQGMVEMRWVARRTGSPAEWAAAPSETLTGTTLSRHVDGQIAESWTRWDGPRALRALGIVPSVAGPRVAPDGRRGRRPRPKEPT